MCIVVYTAIWDQVYCSLHYYMGSYVCSRLYIQKILMFPNQTSLDRFSSSEFAYCSAVENRSINMYIKIVEISIATIQ